MKRLSKPSKGLMKRLLNEVNFEERLIGYRLRQRTGPMPVTLYSFSEVVALLNDPHPRMDFNLLERWIRETMGDIELAGRIKEEIEKDCSNQEKSFLIRDLAGERFLQCRKIL